MSNQAAVIAARVRSARKSKGMSQAELAREAGVAEGTVARLERGEKVRPGNLYSIRVTLGIHEDDPEENQDEVPESVSLALDIVKKMLLAQPDAASIDQKAHELTRYVVTNMM